MMTGSRYPEPPRGQNEVLTYLFDELERQGVRYVVLRNYDDLPQTVDGDLDLLVDDDHASRTVRTLTTLMKESGWLALRRASDHGARSFVCVSSEGVSLKVDIFSTLTWLGHPWIDIATTLDQRVKQKSGFYVPPPGAEAAMLILKDLVQSGVVKSKYRTRISKLAAEDERTFRRAIRPYFGERISETVYKRAVRGEWNTLEASRAQICFALLGRELTSPQTAVKSTFDFVKNRIEEQLTTAKGAFICFVGPDGSGKTTLADEFERLVQDDQVNVHRYHTHFYVLPYLSSLVPERAIRRLVDTDDKNDADDVDVAQSSPSYSDSVATLMMWYYALDYVLGHLRVARPRAKGDVILFDRYFYDYLYDHVVKPSGMGADHPLFRALRRLAPRPDVVVYLRADPSTIHARKPELSVEQIRRQQRGCEEIIDTLGNVQVVDTEGEVSEVVRMMFDVVARAVMN